MYEYLPPTKELIAKASAYAQNPFTPDTLQSAPPSRYSFVPACLLDAFLSLLSSLSVLLQVDGESASKGLSEYRAEGWTVLNACWGVWIPAQFINFYVVPKNFRILFIACVG